VSEQKTISVAVAGAAGRMGRLLVSEVLAADGLTLVAANEHSESPLLGQDAGSVAGRPACGVPLKSDVERLAKADVVIDFTTPDLTMQIAELCAAKKRHLVCGTTGLDATHKAALQKAAEQVAFVFAPNMSVGVNVLLSLVERAIALLGPAYDIEIVEAHHKHKKDAPSGTALRLAETAAAASAALGDLDARACYGRHGHDPRQENQIGVHTVRGGDIVGDHTVMLATDGERLELTHRASNRLTFVGGALRAARWVVSKPAGLYDMRAVLGID
jgi:4-hydroxy-tetrahydrodipicolinate reductase